MYKLIIPLFTFLSLVTPADNSYCSEQELLVEDLVVDTCRDYVGVYVSSKCSGDEDPANKALGPFAAKYYAKDMRIQDDAFRTGIYVGLLEVADQRYFPLNPLHKSNIPVLPPDKMCSYSQQEVQNDCLKILGEQSEKIVAKKTKQMERLKRRKENPPTQQEAAEEITNTLKKMCNQKAVILKTICEENPEPKLLLQQFMEKWVEYTNRMAEDERIGAAGGVALAFGQIKVVENITCTQEDPENECKNDLGLNSANMGGTGPKAYYLNIETPKLYWTKDNGFILDAGLNKGDLATDLVDGKYAYFACDLPFSYRWHYMFPDTDSSIQIILPKNQDHCSMHLFDRRLTSKEDIEQSLATGPLTDCLPYPLHADYSGIIKPNECIKKAYLYINTTEHDREKDEPLPSRAAVIADLVEAQSLSCFGLKKEKIHEAYSSITGREQECNTSTREATLLDQIINDRKRANLNPITNAEQAEMALCDPQQLQALDTPKIEVNKKLAKERGAAYMRFVKANPTFFTGIAKSPQNQTSVYLISLARQAPQLVHGLIRVAKADSCGKTDLLNYPVQAVQSMLQTDRRLPGYTTCDASCDAKLDAFVTNGFDILPRLKLVRFERLRQKHNHLQLVPASLSLLHPGTLHRR